MKSCSRVTKPEEITTANKVAKINMLHAMAEIH